MDQSFEFKEVLTTSSEGTQSSSVHKCFPKRLGCSLKASNILGLKVVFLALKSYENQGLNQNLLISKDNSSVVSYLNKQGGPHSQEMCVLIWRIMAWTNARGIQVWAKCIPGNLNVLADSLS